MLVPFLCFHSPSIYLFPPAYPHQYLRLEVLECPACRRRVPRFREAHSQARVSPVQFKLGSTRSA